VVRLLVAFLFVLASSVLCPFPDQHLYVDNLVIASSYIGPGRGLYVLFADGFESGTTGAWSEVDRNINPSISRIDRSSIGRE